jgi:hypothetical protein
LARGSLSCHHRRREGDRWRGSSSSGARHAHRRAQPAATPDKPTHILLGRAGPLHKLRGAAATTTTSASARSCFRQQLNKSSSCLLCAEGKCEERCGVCVATVCMCARAALVLLPRARQASGKVRQGRVALAPQLRPSEACPCTAQPNESEGCRNHATSDVRMPCLTRCAATRHCPDAQFLPL